MTKATTPSTITIEKADKKDFDLLIEDRGSYFHGRDRKEVFIMAMVYGYDRGVWKPLRDKLSGGYFRVEYLNDQEKTLIKALAVHREGSLDVLLDPKHVYSIAEELAAGGVAHLKEEVFNTRFGTYENRLLEYLVKLCHQLPEEPR